MNTSVLDRPVTKSNLPNEPLYTWTFSRKSLLIRYYLWLYKMDENSVNFCKLFWGTVSSPITLPIRLIGLFFLTVARGVKLFGRGAGWVCETVLGPPIDHFMAWSQQRNERNRERLLAAKKEHDRRLIERAEQERTAYLISAILGLPEQGERPPKIKQPNVPSKIATAIGNFADRCVAFFQEHPQIGLKMDAAMTRIGRIFVRWVFYPLMVIVPIGVFAWTGLQIDHHYHGITRAGHVGWSTPINWLHVAYSAIVNALHIAWVHVIIWMVATIGITLGSILFFWGLMWACLKLDDYQVKHSKKHWEETPLRTDWSPMDDLRIDPRPVNLPGFSVRVKDMLSRRVSPHWSKVAAPLKTGAIVTGRGIGHAAAKVGTGVGSSVFSFAQGTGNVAKFFVVGHHALKSRTCPRIRIVEEDN